MTQRRWGLSTVWVLAALWASAAQAQEVLTLEEALSLALGQNYTVLEARTGRALAANDVTAGNAGFLPLLTLSAGRNGTLSDTRQEFLGDRGTQEVDGALSTRVTAGTQLRWTAFDGLSRFADYNRLEAEASAEAAFAEDTEASVVAEVTILYHELIRQQQQLSVLAEAVSISEERLRIAEARFDLGSASALEVRQALVDLNTDRGAVLRQEAALVEARATLNRLLARPVGTDFEVVPAVEIDTTLSLDRLEALAEAENPLLRQTEAVIRARRQARRAIQAERLPQVDFSLGYGFSNLEAESGFLVSNRSFDWTYGVTLSYDVFDGFNRRRRIQNASLLTRQARIARDEAWARLQASLAALYAQYRSSLELIALEAASLEATRLNVEVALERFRLGTITSVELREVQEQLIRAESRLLQAQFEAKEAETELRRLSGVLR